MTDLETPMNFGDKHFSFIIDPSVTGTDLPEALAGKEGHHYKNNFLYHRVCEVNGITPEAIISKQDVKNILYFLMPFSRTTLMEAAF